MKIKNLIQLCKLLENMQNMNRCLVSATHFSGLLGYNASPSTRRLKFRRTKMSLNGHEFLSVNRANWPASGTQLLSSCPRLVLLAVQILTLRQSRRNFEVAGSRSVDGCAGGRGHGGHRGGRGPVRGKHSERPTARQPCGRRGGGEGRLLTRTR